MDSPFPDPEFLKQGGQYGGWVVVVFLVWWIRLREQMLRREQKQQERSLTALLDFAKAAIASADSPYGKRRELDQKLAEGLAQLRAAGERNAEEAVAKAIAHVVRNGDDA